MMYNSFTYGIKVIQGKKMMYNLGDQFHQFENPGGYIAKLKPQAGVSLQMTQTQGVIM
jgi:hypothetical protein